MAWHHKLWYFYQENQDFHKTRHITVLLADFRHMWRWRRQWRCYRPERPPIQRPQFRLWHNFHPWSWQQRTDISDWKSGPTVSGCVSGDQDILSQNMISPGEKNKVEPKETPRINFANIYSWDWVEIKVELDDGGGEHWRVMHTCAPVLKKYSCHKCE